MCGRFSIAVSKETIAKTFPDVAVPTLETRYNIAPTQQAYVITNHEPRQLQRFQWGLVPHWAQSADGAAKCINARAETLDTKPSFQEPLRHKRCLVISDGFYEWKKDGARRIPYRITLDASELMIFAGIWDDWRGLKSFSIVTTTPNAEMSALHTRMPVLLLTPEAQREWLAETDVEKLLAMCKTPADGILRYFRVSDKVNSVYNEGADLHREVPEDLKLF